MAQKLILGVGCGQCGEQALAEILGRQPDANVSYQEPPLLSWIKLPDKPGMRERIDRLRASRSARFIGDVGSFYLPYLDEAIACEPSVRIICLKRPCQEVVQSFCRCLDAMHPLPTDHWCRKPAPGWHHDPYWTRLFPQYDTRDRQEGIRLYWTEYYRRAEELASEFPANIRVFDSHEALSTKKGMQEVLSFAGIPQEQQVVSFDGPDSRRTEPPPHPARLRRVSSDPLDPRKCVVLVPYTDQIVQACATALKELERRGYVVRRVVGFSAIDQGRNQLATDALLDGFEETMWIDSDVGFDPAAVELLRSHRLPIVAGIYPQKGKRAIACHVIPGTPNLVFGRDGGLREILYVGAGFLLVRREVYLTVQERLQLPMCNERFRQPMIPFFHPMLHRVDDGHWYLAEDYAFCERTRQCGYKIMADTSIRLWHFGSYGYSWEDSGVDRPRYSSFTLNFAPKSPSED